MAISPPTIPSPDDEMPRLVEFAVVGQVHLRHHAEQPAAMDGHRRVVERAGMAQRRADQQQRQQIGGGCNDRGDCRLDRIQQGGLLQQIADRVAGHAKFREHGERRAALVAIACDCKDRLGVGRRVGERAARGAGGDAGKAVSVDRAELKAHSTRCLLLSRKQYGASPLRRHLWRNLDANRGPVPKTAHCRPVADTQVSDLLFLKAIPTG